MKKTNVFVDGDFSNITSEALRASLERTLNMEDGISSKRLIQAYEIDNAVTLQLYKIDFPDYDDAAYIKAAYKFIDRRDKHKVIVVGKAFELTPDGNTEFCKRSKSGKVLRDFSFNKCYEIASALHVADMSRSEARDAVRAAFAEGGVLEKASVYTTTEELRRMLKDVAANDDTTDNKTSGDANDANNVTADANKTENVPDRAAYGAAMEVLKKSIGDAADANAAWLTVCAYVASIDGYNASK